MLYRLLQSQLVIANSRFLVRFLSNFSGTSCCVYAINVKCWISIKLFCGIWGWHWEMFLHITPVCMHTVYYSALADKILNIFVNRHSYVEATCTVVHIKL